MAERVDVAVVGAGPAGVAAAVAAAERGARVALVDDAPDVGGQIWRRDFTAAEHRPPRATEWFDRARACGDRLRRLAESTVVGADRGGLLVHDGVSEMRRIAAERVVLACGARERFLPFPGWTRPGVIGVGGLQALAKQGLDLAGKRVVLAGSGPLMLAVAVDVRSRGAELVALVEQAPRAAMVELGVAVLRQRSKRAQAAALTAKLASVRRLWSAWPVEAHGEGGDGDVDAVTIALGRAGTRRERLGCDLLACGFGLVPELRLARALGCAVEGRLVVDARQRSSLDHVFGAGEVCGIGGVDVALIEGEIAGTVAAGHDVDPELLAARDRERQFATALARAYALRPELRALARPDTVVCRCEDVPRSALERWADPRAAKLHTRCGMGPCQGRVCAPITEFLMGWRDGGERLPLSPVPLSALTSAPRDGDPRDAVSRRDASNHHPL